MISSRLTNGLLLIIAISSLAQLILTLVDRPLMAETFRLDSCVTEKLDEKPLSYVHVAVHSIGR